MIQSLILTLGVVMTLYSIPAQTTYIAVTEDMATSTSVVTPFMLAGDLKRICSCESTGSPNNEPRHFASDGSVLRGKVNPNDIGQCQINIDPEITDWLRISQSVGLDVFEEEDNARMAQWIYDHYGSQPWSWSAGCHGVY